MSLIIVLHSVVAIADTGSSVPLSNINYISKWTQSGRAPLQNGEYLEPLNQGSNKQTKVTLTNISAHGPIIARSTSRSGI